VRLSALHSLSREERIMTSMLRFLAVHFSLRIEARPRTA
jgi:hypothetical protein